MEEKELKDRQNKVFLNNMVVSVMENLKKFLAKIISEAVSSIKKNIFRVEVQNPVEFPREISISNQKDYSSSIVALESAIKQIPKTEIVSVSNFNEIISALSALQSAVESQPEPIDAVSVSNLKTLEDGLSKLEVAVKSIKTESVEVKTEKTDTSKLEKLLVAVISELEKNRPKEVNLSLPEEKEEEKIVSETIRRDLEYRPTAFITEYETYTEIGTVKRDPDGVFLGVEYSYVEK